MVYGVELINVFLFFEDCGRIFTFGKLYAVI